MSETYKYKKNFKKQLGTSLAVERYSVNIHIQNIKLELSGSLNMDLYLIYANNCMAYKRKFWKKLLVSTSYLILY